MCGRLGCKTDQKVDPFMNTTCHQTSPEVAASSLALAAEVFGLWQAGKRVVLDSAGISVDGVPFLGSMRPSGPINESLTLAARNQPNIFQFDGMVWTLQFDGKRVVKNKQLGFLYIHSQLKTPCVGVNAKEMVAAINCHKFNCSKPEQVSALNDDEGFANAPSLASSESVSVDQKADQATQQQVLKKMKSLRADLESYRNSGDEIAAEEAEDEIDELEEYLREYFRAGRSTKFNSSDNKNRKSVKVAITRAIESISEDHPTLAQHLKNSIKTGFSCGYFPEKETVWVL
jgi:hypothetical protein